jgi:hypothetical protein
MIGRIMLFVLFSGALAACAPIVADKALEGIVSGSQKASAAGPVFPEITDWLAQNSLGVNAGQDGRIDYDGAFDQGFVIAYGEGAPVADASGPGQKRLTAVRAAEVVAQRNLAEFFARHAMNGEIRFTSSTVRLEAFLKGAVMVANEYDPGRERAAVLLKLDLRGATGFSDL